MNFSGFNTVKPENWKGICEIVSLQVECKEFIQLREKYALPQINFFFVDSGCQRTTSQSFKIPATVAEKPAYSGKLQEIMKGTYTGTFSQFGFGLIYLQIGNKLERGLSIKIGK